MLTASQPKHITTDPAGSGALLESAVPAMARVLRLAVGVAPTPATILMTGESGTGKEVLARFIHDQSERGQGPFVAINCGAITASLAESELFGHERGAFSGAMERRIGRIEAAHGGTLLLDEISEMPLELQTRLLRVLQEREVTRVGGSLPVALNIRVIATTNRDLRACVAQGSFREDLYYRLNVFPIHVPSLRRRRGDIPALAHVLIHELSEQFGRNGVTITDGALARLADWHWPGNVRELRNTIERALILAPSDRIDSAHIVLERDLIGLAPEPMALQSDAPRSLRDLEQETILRVLADYGGNRTQAASELGISVRTLRNRLRDYRADGVEIPGPTSRRAIDEATGLLDAATGSCGLGSS
jgi:two-component system response regulator FlrC